MRDFILFASLGFGLGCLFYIERHLNRIAKEIEIRRAQPQGDKL